MTNETLVSHDMQADIEKRASQGIFGYTDPKEDYFEAVKGWFKRRHGFDIENDWITITHGVVYAIVLAIRALTDPGEAVLVQQPVYYPFGEAIRDNDRVLVDSPLKLIS
jgi:cystathionine beta-lyase